MEHPAAPEDPFARLAPARSASHGARWRWGIGAAIVVLVVALAASVVISAVGAQSNRSTIKPATDSAAHAETDATGQAGEADERTDAGGQPQVFVHVLGAVTNPGLFQLGEGARVIDVIAAAGGLAENADPAGVNLARLVSDGEQLYVPAVGEVVAGQVGGAGGSGAAGAGGAGGAGGVSGGKVNLNTATSVELQTLPRIGEAMAQRIIDYRDANGRFSSIDDLRNITGIGDKTFDALKDLVTL